VQLMYRRIRRKGLPTEWMFAVEKATIFGRSAEAERPALADALRRSPDPLGLNFRLLTQSDKNIFRHNSLPDEIIRLLINIFDKISHFAS
jgi:hypothetical protein